MTGARRFDVTSGSELISVELLREGKANVGGQILEYEVVHLAAGCMRLIVGGHVYRIQTQAKGLGVEMGEMFALQIDGIRLSLVVEDEAAKLVRSLGKTNYRAEHIATVRAPMPGLVSRLEVARGDQVVPGQGLVILEAMKMENEIRSSVQGEVKEVLVQPGRPVEKGEPLLTIG